MGGIKRKIIMREANSELLRNPGLLGGSLVVLYIGGRPLGSRRSSTLEECDEAGPIYVVPLPAPGCAGHPV